MSEDFLESDYLLLMDFFVPQQRHFRPRTEVPSWFCNSCEIHIENEAKNCVYLEGATMFILKALCVVSLLVLASAQTSTYLTPGEYVNGFLPKMAASATFSISVSNVSSSQLTIWTNSSSQVNIYVKANGPASQSKYDYSDTQSAHVIMVPAPLLQSGVYNIFMLCATRTGCNFTLMADVQRFAQHI